MLNQNRLPPIERSFLGLRLKFLNFFPKTMFNDKNKQAGGVFFRLSGVRSKYVKDSSFKRKESWDVFKYLGSSKSDDTAFFKSYVKPLMKKILIFFKPRKFPFIFSTLKNRKEKFSKVLKKLRYYHVKDPFINRYRYNSKFLNFYRISNVKFNFIRKKKTKFGLSKKFKKFKSLKNDNFSSNLSFDFRAKKLRNIIKRIKVNRVSFLKSFPQKSLLLPKSSVTIQPPIRLRCKVKLVRGRRLLRFFKFKKPEYRPLTDFFETRKSLEKTNFKFNKMFNRKNIFYKKRKNFLINLTSTNEFKKSDFTFSDLVHNKLLRKRFKTLFQDSGFLLGFRPRLGFQEQSIDWKGKRQQKSGLKKIKLENKSLENREFSMPINFGRNAVKEYFNSLPVSDKHSIYQFPFNKFYDRKFQMRKFKMVKNFNSKQKSGSKTLSIKRNYKHEYLLNKEKLTILHFLSSDLNFSPEKALFFLKSRSYLRNHFPTKLEDLRENDFRRHIFNNLFHISKPLKQVIKNPKVKSKFGEVSQSELISQKAMNSMRLARFITHVKKFRNFGPYRFRDRFSFKTGVGLSKIKETSYNKYTRRKVSNFVYHKKERNLFVQNLKNKKFNIENSPNSLLLNNYKDVKQLEGWLIFRKDRIDKLVDNALVREMGHFDFNTFNVPNLSKKLHRKIFRKFFKFKKLNQGKNLIDRTEMRIKFFKSISDRHSIFQRPHLLKILKGVNKFEQFLNGYKNLKAEYSKVKTMFLSSKIKQAKLSHYFMGAEKRGGLLLEKTMNNLYIIQNLRKHLLNVRITRMHLEKINFPPFLINKLKNKEKILLKQIKESIKKADFLQLKLQKSKMGLNILYYNSKRFFVFGSKKRDKLYEKYKKLKAQLNFSKRDLKTISKYLHIGVKDFGSKSNAVKSKVLKKRKNFFNFKNQKIFDNYKISNFDFYDMKHYKKFFDNSENIVSPSDIKEFFKEKRRKFHSLPFGRFKNKNVPISQAFRFTGIEEHELSYKKTKLRRLHKSLRHFYRHRYHNIRLPFFDFYSFLNKLPHHNRRSAGTSRMKRFLKYHQVVTSDDFVFWVKLRKFMQLKKLSILDHENLNSHRNFEQIVFSKRLNRKNRGLTYRFLIDFLNMKNKNPILNSLLSENNLVRAPKEKERLFKRLRRKYGFKIDISDTLHIQKSNLSKASNKSLKSKFSFSSKNYTPIYKGTPNFLYTGMRYRSLSKSQISLIFKNYLIKDPKLNQPVIDYLGKIILESKKDENLINLYKFKSRNTGFRGDMFQDRFRKLLLNDLSKFGENRENSFYNKIKSWNYIPCPTFKFSANAPFEKLKLAHLIRRLRFNNAAVKEIKAFFYNTGSTDQRTPVLYPHDFDFHFLYRSSPFMKFFNGKNRLKNEISKKMAESEKLKSIFINTQGNNSSFIHSLYTNRYFYNIFYNSIKFGRPIKNKFVYTQSFIGNSPSFDFLHLPEWSFLSSWLLRFKSFGHSIDYKTLEYQPLTLDKIRAYEKGHTIRWSHYNFKFRPVKTVLEQPRNLAWSGVVHNPMLWFGHFFESANVLERQYHSFLLYRERFRFMLNFFSPKQHFFFGVLPTTFKNNLNLARFAEDYPQTSENIPLSKKASHCKSFETFSNE